MLTEISEFLHAIDYQRSKILRILETADLALLNWSPVEGSTNSLFVLGTHVIGSEHSYIFETPGNGKKTRDRASEFVAQGNSLDNLRTEYARVAEETKQVLSALTAEDMETTRNRVPHGDVTVRWILLHVVQHATEHMGHMELTKQLWEQKKAQGDGFALLDS